MHHENLQAHLTCAISFRGRSQIDLSESPLISEVAPQPKRSIAAASNAADRFVGRRRSVVKRRAEVQFRSGNAASTRITSGATWWQTDVKQKANVFYITNNRLKYPQG